MYLCFTVLIFFSFSYCSFETDFDLVIVFTAHEKDKKKNKKKTKKEWKKEKREKQLMIDFIWFQGWLHTRPVSEQSVFMDLFENSFPIVYRQAIQNWTFKMDVLEAFVIAQVKNIPKIMLLKFPSIVAPIYFCAGRLCMQASLLNKQRSKFSATRVN